ncbi:MAG: sensor histidine kinase [Paenibacillaceae bacterium]
MKIRAFVEWSIKLKLLIMTAGLILCSVFLVSVLSYMQYTRDFSKQSSDRIDQIIDQVSINIDTYLDDLFRLSLSPYRNDAVMKALDRSEQESEIRQLEKRWMVEQFLDDMMIIPRRDIWGVMILTDDIYYSGRINPGSLGIEDYRQYDWFQAALKTQDQIYVPTDRQTESGIRDVQLFSIVKQIRSTQNTQDILGVIKVDANYKGIEDIASRVDMGIDGGLYILDESDRVIYSSTKNNKKHQAALAQLTNPLASRLTAQTEQNEYLVNRADLPRFGWTIVAIHSFKELNKDASHTRNIAFLMAIICSFLAIGVLYFFVKKVMNPLLAIVKLMKDVERGNLKVRFPNQRSDEIGYLGTSFNALVIKISDMLNTNTSLVKEVYEAQLLQKEAQIRTLFNQIRPHFIFNTLNMISLSMQSGKQDRAIDHIEKLSSILRSMTDWDREISLQRELELLNAYLSIQSSRYEGRLEYVISIDPKLRSCLIPALLLQPIVENAVVHGCETKRDLTTIQVIGQIGNQAITFRIIDDGQGMDTHTLKQLQNRLEQSAYMNQSIIHIVDRTSYSSSGTGIGLVNVHRRIQLRYGDPYGIEVESQQGKGTQVTVTLPYNSEQE